MRHNLLALARSRTRLILFIVCRFTWAMIAIELLQRQKLYVGLDVGHVLTGVRDGRLMPAIRDPSETSIPGALMDLIMECAARNPRRRPAAPEVVSRMQEIQRRQSAAAAPSPRTEELMLSVFPAEIAKQLAEGKTVVRRYIAAF